jgi:oxygen-independent coproporphyrinogen-3 oxidase
VLRKVTGEGAASDLAALAVYVHWPFCSSKCPYCDFNSHARAEVDETRWRQAYARAIGRWARALPDRRIDSVFFGGGTPSRMDPHTVAAVLGEIRGGWRVADDWEVSLEANPTSSDAERFAGFRDAGVNRLSIGVQSFDDAVLTFLGRSHDADAARAAVAAAARSFARYSLDLIYAWPGQTRTQWRAELRTALAVAGDHLSAYQLTIEAGTPFHRQGVGTADEDTAADLFDLVQDTTAAAGLEAYEISNHARPGGACRHNVAVWRGGDYLGVGPGAHGRITTRGGTVAVRQIRQPDRWLASVDHGGDGTAHSVTLTRRERQTELILTGLRLTEGIDVARYRERTGGSIDDLLNTSVTDDLVADGFLHRSTTEVRATAAGRRCLDGVLRALLT